MRGTDLALRLRPSLLDELRKAAELKGVVLNQLINVEMAEKVSALRTEGYFREWTRRGDRAETLRILERAGKGNPPVKIWTHAATSRPCRRPYLTPKPLTPQP